MHMQSQVIQVGESQARASSEDSTLCFRARRERLFEALARSPETAKALVLVPAAPVFHRNNDVEHEYRQESDFFYLVGLDEPKALAVLDVQNKKFTLFVRPRDKARETWDGIRAGVLGATAEFGADEAFEIGELEAKLPSILRDHETVIHRFGRSKDFDAKLLTAIDASKAFARTGSTWPVRILDPGPSLHELRLIKSQEEIACMRKAAAISCEAHLDAMRATQPLAHEFEIEALLLERFRRAGSERVAYGSIVGSGPNATILHHRKNDRQMRDGELLLIDAGCEYRHYASDITRTFPVSGRFTATQREVYDCVLKAQLTAIGMVKPGVTLDQIHDRVVAILTEGMTLMGLLIVDEHADPPEVDPYKRFYMHRTSHWLGMDVHDVGAYFVTDGEGKRVARPLEPGMVLTIEPGIYVAIDDERAPEKFRGIGIRIEDDILVTETGYENLTAACPKDPTELERICQGI
jgi:Xaa-Pro aminopeptidase